MTTAPTVVVFPGQGSQKVGMARDFHEASAAARDVFATASEALGLDVARLCFEEADRLGLTEFTQPAILTAEIAMLRALEEGWGFAPTRFAGHSLGEYTALVAAGALPLTEAVVIVRERGRRMQEAVAAGEGAMAAVIREPLDHDALQGLLEGLVVDVANVNSSEQVVISGAAIDMATATARIDAALALAGARVVALDVSAPFHSRLMAPIEPAFRELLAAASWVPERARAVVSNVTGAFHEGDRASLVDLLTRQISSPVRWDLDMRALLDLEPARVVEVGPKRPLRAFFRSLGVDVDGIFNLVSARRTLGDA